MQVHKVQAATSLPIVPCKRGQEIQCKLYFSYLLLLHVAPLKIFEMTNKETLQNGVWNEIIRSEVRAGKN
jgi:hypothetical protein